MAREKKTKQKTVWHRPCTLYFNTMWSITARRNEVKFPVYRLCASFNLVLHAEGMQPFLSFFFFLTQAQTRNAFHTSGSRLPLSELHATTVNKRAVPKRERRASASLFWFGRKSEDTRLMAAWEQDASAHFLPTERLQHYLAIILFFLLYAFGETYELTRPDDGEGSL